MTAVSVDPRLKARRAAVRRDVGRRRLRRLVLAASTILVVLVSYVIARSPLLDINEVSYVGLEQTSLDAALVAASVDLGDPLIGLDLDAIGRRLEALPWVETASVERSWTGRLSIEITERQALAAVMAAQDEWVLVDASGRILTGVIVVSPDVPKISGVSAAGEPGTRLPADASAPLRLAELLPPRLDGRVDGIYVDAIGELWVSLKSADRILLGTDSDLAFKVISFTTVLEELDDRGQVLWELDVSVPSLPVVRDLRGELLPAASTSGQ